jgi:ribonuclease G
VDALNKQIIANVEPFEARVALFEEGKVLNILIERGEPLAGNIYKGKVANVLRGMDAAFVDIGLQRNAFLHVADVRSHRIGGEDLEGAIGEGSIQQRLRPGQEIVVQVTKEPMGTKGARVTTYVALPAYYMVLMPTVSYVGVSRRIEGEGERRRLREIAERIRPQGMGVIVRTAAEGVTEKDLHDDLRYLLSVWSRVLERARANRAPALLYQDLRLIRRVVRDLFTGDVERFVVDSPREYERIGDLVGSYAPHLRGRVELYREAEPIFERFGVERELRSALRRKVWLPSGGYIVVDRTEALTVIDVNTGKYVGNSDLAATILHANLEAVREVVRQIRLRDIGGIILVDFIDMESDAHRKQVLGALHEAVKRDRAKMHIIDLTQLGLVEITRKRVYQDLEEVMRMPCPYCDGKGRVLSVETMAHRVRRELRGLLTAQKPPAVLVHVHPLVYTELTGDGGSWLRQMEEQMGGAVRIAAREGMHLEQMDVASLASPADLELAATARGGGHIHWLDTDTDVMDVALDSDEEQERALALLRGQRRWWDRMRRLLARR